MHNFYIIIILFFSQYHGLIASKIIVKILSSLQLKNHTKHKTKQQSLFNCEGNFNLICSAVNLQERSYIRQFYAYTNTHRKSSLMLYCSKSTNLMWQRSNSCPALSN